MAGLQIDWTMSKMFKFLTPIQGFALLCVAVTSAFFGYLTYWLIDILSSPGWCAKAIQADRITPGDTFTGLTACVDLLKMQVGSLSNALLMMVGTFALCLGVLVVIVIAGARLAGKIFGNVEVSVSKEDKDETSDHPADL